MESLPNSQSEEVKKIEADLVYNEAKVTINNLFETLKLDKTIEPRNISKVQFICKKFIFSFFTFFFLSLETSRKSVLRYHRTSKKKIKSF